ncbi:MAG: PAS domain-containing sensor histidine kinase, partial [Planctomycetota bacterium]
AVIAVILTLSFMVITLLINILKRKGAETALKESEYKYRILFESTAEGILIADAKTRKFLYANHAICDLLGYSEKELTQLGMENIHPKESLDYVMAQFKAQANGKNRLATDIPCLRKDGSIFYSDINATVTNMEEKQCMMGFFRDVTNRKKSEEELQKSRDLLEQRVQQRTQDLAKAVAELRNEIAERKKAEEQLIVYQNWLRSLASELALAEERLRRKIAVDIHDGFGQSLAITKIKVESLARLTSSEKIQQALNEISDLIGQTIQSTRTMTFELSPPVLYELGLEAAIEWLVRQTRERDGLSTAFEDDKQYKPVAENIRIILFQAVRELLVNVVKHAGAKQVKVSTKRVDTTIQIIVKDDGVGFDVAQTDFHDYSTPGFGLFNIRERLGHVGGKIEINSAIGKGTVTTLTAPIDVSERINK